MKYITLYILAVVVVSTAFAVQPVFAQGVPSPVAAPTTGSLPSTTAGQGLFTHFSSDACFEQGTCTMEDLVQLVVNIINFLLGIAGVVALLFFAYGGYNWITSAGSSEKIDAGRKMLGGAIVGILIVLGAWLGVRFILKDWLGVEVSSGLRIGIAQPPSSEGPLGFSFTPPEQKIAPGKGACCWYYYAAEEDAAKTIPGSGSFKTCQVITQADCAQHAKSPSWNYRFFPEVGCTAVMVEQCKNSIP